MWRRASGECDSIRREESDRVAAAASATRFRLPLWILASASGLPTDVWSLGPACAGPQDDITLRDRKSFEWKILPATD